MLEIKWQTILTVKNMPDQLTQKWGEKKQQQINLFHILENRI